MIQPIESTIRHFVYSLDDLVDEEVALRELAELVEDLAGELVERRMWHLAGVELIPMSDVDR